eukprot:3774391-Prymnesium_polylepis.1
MFMKVGVEVVDGRYGFRSKHVITFGRPADGQVPSNVRAPRCPARPHAHTKPHSSRDGHDHARMTRKHVHIFPRRSLSLSAPAHTPPA